MSKITLNTLREMKAAHEKIAVLTAYDATFARILEAAGVEVPSDFTVDGRSFLPQLRGQKGNPRDWIYCWYSRHGGSKATFEFAMDKHYKVYADGRFFDLKTDIDEQHPLKDSALTPHARDAKQQLAAVFGRFQNVRPKSIIAQADPRAESTE